MLTDKRVLVVEDDQHICEVIYATFEKENIDVDICHDGITGLEKGQNQHYDLIILDLMLPGKDGLEVCKQLRQNGFLLPIVMLTAKVDEVDKVLGLELGADDYITKPFSPRELVARCKAVLRRFEHSTQVTHGNGLVLAELNLARDQYKATANGQNLDLTPKEFELLLFLAENPGRTFPRTEILDHVWGFEVITETRTVDEHVKRIRRKLKQVGVNGVRIKTIWGVGYQFEVVNHDG